MQVCAHKPPPQKGPLDHPPSITNLKALFAPFLSLCIPYLLCFIFHQNTYQHLKLNYLFVVSFIGK